MTHALKTIPAFFADIASGKKQFEVRKNDRNFKAGDKILLQEYDPEKGYTGQEWEGSITYLMDNPDYCKKGFVIFSIKEREAD
jgi:hypothetical protein